MLYGDDILWILVMLSGDDDGDSNVFYEIAPENLQL